MMPLNSSTFGKAGEEAVASYLKKRLWRVIARNYRSRGGELDIVAYRFGVLAIVEVKTRSSDAFGSPSDAVTAEKQRRIKSAYYGFAYEQMKYKSVPVWSFLRREQVLRHVRKTRFDVAEVYMDRAMQNKTINYIKNFFEIQTR